MSEFISRDTLYDEIADIASSTHHDVMSVKDLLRSIEAAPAVDAVPVVRCGKCAKAKKFHNPQMGVLILCNEYRVFTDECGFCHKGAKMVGGADDGEG